MSSLYLNPVGKIGMGAYWIGVPAALAPTLLIALLFGVWVASFPLFGVLLSPPQRLVYAGVVLVTLLCPVQVYVLFCLFAKRLRDAGHAGRWGSVVLALSLVWVVMAEIWATDYVTRLSHGSWEGALALSFVWPSVWVLAWGVAALPIGLLQTRA